MKLIHLALLCVLLVACGKVMTRSGVQLEIPPDTMGVCAEGDRFLHALKGLQVDDPKDYVARALGEPEDRTKSEWYYWFIEDTHAGGYTLHVNLTFDGDRLRTVIVSNGHATLEPRNKP